MEHRETDLRGELFDAYALWLRRRVACMRDWMRCGEHRRVAIEARMLSARAIEMGLMDMAYVSRQIQVSATLNATRHEARWIGVLISQIEQLSSSARATRIAAPMMP